MNKWALSLPNVCKENANLLHISISLPTVDRDTHEYFFCRPQSNVFDARAFFKPITWYINSLAKIDRHLKQKGETKARNKKKMTRIKKNPAALNTEVTVAVQTSSYESTCKSGNTLIPSTFQYLLHLLSLSILLLSFLTSFIFYPPYFQFWDILIHS